MDFCFGIDVEVDDAEKPLVEPAGDTLEVDNLVVGNTRFGMGVCTFLAVVFIPDWTEDNFLSFASSVLFWELMGDFSVLIEEPLTELSTEEVMKSILSEAEDEEEYLEDDGLGNMLWETSDWGLVDEDRLPETSNFTYIGINTRAKISSLIHIILNGIEEEPGLTACNFCITGFYF